MAEDQQTISVYDEQAEEYLALSATAEPEPLLIKFMSRLPKGAPILDFGCGPGHHAAQLFEAGFTVTATDASAAMVDLAVKHEGITVRQANFEELTEKAVYAGIWANFSLLHATKADLPAHLERIAAALKPNGHLHIAMKTGKNDARDRIGRFYSYYSELELADYLRQAGFAVDYRETGEGKALSGEISPWVALQAVLTDS